MNEKDNYTIKNLKGMKMTPEEKAKVWDGVLRRVTDYPEGEYPFEKSNTWDGVFRRKTDFPDSIYPSHMQQQMIDNEEGLPREEN